MGHLALLRILRICAVSLLICAATSGLAAEVSTLGILGFRPAAEEQARWQGLADYLNASIPDHRFEVHVMGYFDLEAAIAARSVDFVLTNPGHYVLMTYRNGMSSPLATVVAMENGKVLDGFGGVVFTRADRTEITRIGDLRGRSVAAVSKGSLGGFQAQAKLLLDNDLHIPGDTRLIETEMPHDRVVTAVMSGQADAGFVRTGVLEALASKGNLDLDKVRILNEQPRTDFPFRVSTILYPEWPLAAMPGVDGDLARRVSAALFSLPHGGKVADAMQIHGFDIPADYERVRTTLQALRLPPFDVSPSITLQDIWEQYRGQTVAGFALVMLVAVLGLWLVVLNRRLAADQRQLDRKAQEWLALITAIGEGIYGIGPDGRCTFINPAALSMLGRPEQDILGKNTHEVFHYLRADGAPYPSNECPVFHTLLDGRTRHIEDWFLRPDGSSFPVAVTATKLVDGNERGNVVCVFRDISDRKRLEAALREEAATDVLTGLPNRRYFLAEMERHWARIVRNEERPGAVLMLDLDRFKAINDTHGHAVGDEVLKHLAGVVRESLRRGDLIGRLGGEEFAILQVDATETEAMQLAERLRNRIEAAVIDCNGVSLHYTLSIGVTLMLGDDHSIRAPLQRADAALYRAKGTGRNRVAWEDPHAPSPHL